MDVVVFFSSRSSLLLQAVLAEGRSFVRTRGIVQVIGVVRVQDYTVPVWMVIRTSRPPVGEGPGSTVRPSPGPGRGFWQTVPPDPRP